MGQLSNGLINSTFFADNLLSLQPKFVSQIEQEAR